MQKKKTVLVVAILKKLRRLNTTLSCRLKEYHTIHVQRTGISYQRLVINPLITTVKNRKGGPRDHIGKM